MPAFLSYSDDSSPLAHSRPRRRGVVLSCAECRRLKLKCSRDFPCSNCVKKGCAAICPTGSLTTGRGNRFVLANTEVLHDKITDLANRVRQLEDALHDSHAVHSSATHPLLAEDLLQIKRPLERDRADQISIKEERSEGIDTIDALGSLSISHNGRANFYGKTANSWYLLKNEEGSSEDDPLPENGSLMPTNIPSLHHAFPFAQVPTSLAESYHTALTESLPHKATARALSKIYFRHAAWMYTPISENEFLDTILEPFYEPDRTPLDATMSHRLAILYMVLALGTMLDLDRPFNSPETMHYYQLARAALSLESVLEEPSASAVQALLLMTHFMFLSEMGSPRWVIMGIVVKLAISIGLHRDSVRWNLDPEDTQKRRKLFYEVYTYDLWQSLTFGRPPSFSLVHVDCKFPFSLPDEKANVDTAFRAWKHQYTAECMSQVMDEAFSAKPPRYKVIQELDKKVRNWYVPPILRINVSGSPKMGKEMDDTSVELTMQRFTTFAIKEMTLFYMHRGFFAQALEGNPADPMASKYAESVLAAYRGACTFVGEMDSLFNQHQALLERLWFYFTHVFSCAIVLGTIAAKPQLSLARSAQVYLETAYNLFSRVSDSTRIAKILPILQALREKAHSSHLNLKQLPPPDSKSDLEGLYALGGMTRLVSRKTTSPSSSQAGSVSPASQPASPHIVRDSISYQQQPPPWSTFNSHHVSPEMNGFHHQYFVMPQQHYSTSEIHTPAHSHSHSHSHAAIPQPTSFEVVPGFYGYPSQPGALHSPMVDSSAPVPDLTMSWQNFMAQYK
ncbi:hypothetical protein APHAL10511_002181 [Amanita phalloides]|nr:hypothetical protein APHAL10511_002181 [Amanita phalloides]